MISKLRMSNYSFFPNKFNYVFAFSLKLKLGEETMVSDTKNTRTRNPHLHEQD